MSSTVSCRRKQLKKLIGIFALIALGGLAFGIGNHAVQTGPAEGSEFFGPPATEPAGPYLRIGTFNIDGGEGLDGKLDLARTAKCMQKLDFIAMQEVHGFIFQQPKNQVLELCQLLHLPGIYVPSEKRWGHETFGNAAFSDLPITHWQRIVLPSEPFHAKRNYLLTDALWHNKPIHFITTHTDWKSGGVKQFEIVRDVFLNLPTPAILMGDLNTPHSDDLIKNLEKTPGVEESIGKKLDPIPGRVDWIFIRGLTTDDAGQVELEPPASDHPAYWASVKLK
jgi:endonuclease/exonuclease/phosphatase family metal-dependent hydrolase